jgi:hypothetical protein
MLVLVATPGRSSVSQCLWTAQQRAGARFRRWDEEINADQQPYGLCSNA